MTIEFIHFSIAQQNEIPVIFVHKGKSNFLEYALWQAKKFNKRVIILGDQGTYARLSVESYNLADYSKEATYFASIYKHLSHSLYERELACFQRWFFLEEFMRLNNIQTAFHAESDVMLYCDVTKEYKYFKENEVSYIHCSPEYKGGLVSYWDLKTLQEFCRYLKSFYENKEKIAKLVQQFTSKTAWYYHDDIPMFFNFLHDILATRKTGILNALIDSALFDSNIQDGWHWQPGMQQKHFFETKRVKGFKVKRIRWINGLPYCYNKGLKKLIRFKSLHFQGPTKNLMSSYKA